MSPWSYINMAFSTGGENPTMEDTSKVLRQRYAAAGPGNTTQAFMEDVGYKNPPTFKFDSKLDPKVGASYNRYTNEIKVNPNTPASGMPATLAHELMHAKDYETNPLWYSTKLKSRHTMEEPPSNLHFHDYPLDQSEGLFQNLEGQRILNMGFDLDPQIKNNLPWLERAQPYSSQRFVGPWSIKWMIK